MDNDNLLLSTLHSDLPRILRKDITEVSEMIAKYRGLKAVAELGLEDVIEPLLQLRIELDGALTRASAASGAGGPIGPNAQADEIAVVSAMGKPISLITALVNGGFVSKLDVAKKGIEQGYVEVDGVKIEAADHRLDLGTYVVKCGEVTQRIRID